MKMMRAMSLVGAFSLLATGGCSGSGDDEETDGGAEETGPPEASFFEGVWEMTQVATDVPCDIELADVEFSNDSGFREFSASETGASYTGYRCYAEDDCRDVPLVGNRFTLIDDVWRGSDEDHWTSSEGCVYHQYYVEHHKDGDGFYEVTYRDARPSEGNSEELGGCIGHRLPDFICQTKSVVRLERPGASDEAMEEPAE